MQDNTTNKLVIQCIIDRAEEQIKDATGETVKLELRLECFDDNNPLDKIALLFFKIWGILPDELKEHSRRNIVVTRKQVFATIARDSYPVPTLEELGNYLGGYDHASVINWLKTAKYHLEKKDRLFLSIYEPVKHLFDATNN